MRFLIKVFFTCIFLVSSCFAYNQNGHKVIAQIAYDNLTPFAKNRVDELAAIIGQYYAFNQFVGGAAWPDWLIKNKITAYNTWHYINQPFIKGSCQSCQIKPPPAENVIWAILQAEQVLETSPASQTIRANFEKSQFLLFFEHFVGDIHQPLHNITLFSDAFPRGDRGGTLYPIKSPIADNLHVFWDEGGGIFPAKSLSKKQIKLLALKIEIAYPPTTFSQQVNNLDPVEWSKEGNQIGRDLAYTLPENGIPDQIYREKAQSISEERAALTGYRMANFLNQLFIN